MYVHINKEMEEIKEKLDKALEHELNSIKLRDSPSTCSEFIDFFKNVHFQFLFNFFLLYTIN